MLYYIPEDNTLHNSDVFVLCIMASLPSIVTAGRESLNIGGGAAAYYPRQLLHKLVHSFSTWLLPPDHSYG
jgi:hypothetical protein